MKTPIGDLTGADEQFLHQTTEMFTTVSVSDPAWTERAYGCVILKSGALALHCGLGKYTNRNVMDGFAGIASGRRQRNVRFSRRLAPTPLETAVGPFRYEVLEPLKAARLSLEASEHQPISFELTLHTLEQPWVEERTCVQRGYRRVQDEVRYVMPTTASGWMEYEGQRIVVERGDNFGFRDHSWGVKQNTGPASPETPDRASMPAGVQYRMIWCPAVLDRPDGSQYRVHLFFWEVRSPRGGQTVNESQVFLADGSSLHAIETRYDLRFDPATREPLGGFITLAMPDGSLRPFEIEIAAESRVCLGAGLYHGYNGHYHGEARGKLHVEGECLEDTGSRDTCRSIHQLRDILVKITDPVGGGQGYGILNTEIVGAWPGLGLPEEYWR